MAKAQRPNGNAAPTASDRATKKTSKTATVTDADVARRAYELYLARGRQDGHDSEDWLQAERELNGPTKGVSG